MKQTETLMNSGLSKGVCESVLKKEIMSFRNLYYQENLNRNNVHQTVQTIKYKKSQRGKITAFKAKILR